MIIQYLQNKYRMNPDDTLQINAVFPPKLIDPLFNSTARYKIFYGGRAGGKSHSIARALLLEGIQRPLRVLCVRDFMISIAQSVWKLLCDCIIDLGLSGHYIVEKSSIYAPNGTAFSFAGIRNNPSALKSYEGIDVAWVEEGQSCTRLSWEVLIPTIRKQGSRIYVSMNPELETDETFQRFIVNPPPDCVITKINFDENPFCPQVIKDEAAYMQHNDPDAYHNVWLGFPKVFLENAIFGKELRQAQAENRITKVPYEPLLPVDRFWDLGWRDQTVCLMAQVVAGEFRIIDCLQSSQKSIVEYLKLLQQKPYFFGFDYLPHDAKAKSLGSGRSIEEIMRSNGCKVRIVPRLSINDGIDAARVIFGRTWFDETRCADLIQSLRKYRYDMTGERPVPIHDENSHAADAFKYCAISLRPPKAKKPAEERKYEPYQHSAGSSVGWMAL